MLFCFVEGQTLAFLAESSGLRGSKNHFRSGQNLPSSLAKPKNHLCCYNRFDLVYVINLPIDIQLGTCDSPIDVEPGKWDLPIDVQPGS